MGRAGGLLSGIIVFRFAPEAEGHGTDAAIAAFHHGARRIRARIPAIKLIASAITIGACGSRGREGLTAPIFGMIGGAAFTDPTQLLYYGSIGLAAGVLGRVYISTFYGATAWFARRLGYGWVQRGARWAHTVGVAVMASERPPVAKIVATSLSIGSRLRDRRDDGPLRQHRPRSTRRDADGRGTDRQSVDACSGNARARAGNARRRRSHDLPLAAAQPGAVARPPVPLCPAADGFDPDAPRCPSAALVLQADGLVARDRLRASKLPGAPVVGRSGILKGSVTAADLTAAQPDSRLADLVLDGRVVSAEDGLDDALATLADAHRSWAPVTADDKLIGIISVGDILAVYRSSLAASVQCVRSIDESGALVEADVRAQSSLAGMRVDAVGWPREEVLQLLAGGQRRP